MTWRDDERVKAAREDVLFSALNFDDQNYYAKWEAEMDDVLNAYAEAVASAVLAEQGCYLTENNFSDSARICWTKIGSDRSDWICPPCAERAKRKEVP